MEGDEFKTNILEESSQKEQRNREFYQIHLKVDTIVSL
jgi:hypothetical protein